MSKPSTQQNFIDKANVVHNYTYDYSLVNYINSRNKVIVLCKKHGEFLSDPKAHLLGFGCVKCSRMDKNDFLEEAIKVHGNKYSYEQVNYINKATPITIICSIHGEFTQTPMSHLKGSNCVKCSRTIATEKQTYTIVRFLELAHAKHKGKYTYIDPIYVDNRSIINIKCPIHGMFSQKAYKHLSGQGCRLCTYLFSSISKTVANIDDTPTKLYYAYFPSLNLWKIGCSKQTIQKRLNDCGHKYELLFYNEYDTAIEAYTHETYLLKYSIKNRITSKPLKYSGNSELRSKPIHNFISLLHASETSFNIIKNKGKEYAKSSI